MHEIGSRLGMPGGLWFPPVALLAVAATAFVLYQMSPPAIANVVILPYAFSLVLGPSIVYPWLRWRGVSIGRAAAAALCVPALWVLKESYALHAIFSIWEIAFYLFNPLAFGLFLGAAFQMALAELLLRRVRHGRWELANGAGVICGTLVIVFAVLAAVGRMSFYVYITAYSWLFGD